MLHAFSGSIAHRLTVGLFTLLLTIVVLLSPAARFTAQAAINDTPTPFVVDSNVEQWSVGAGLVYWAYNCDGEEFPGPTDSAKIKRKPAGGGTEQQLDPSNENDVATCHTYRNMVSSGDGLYFIESTFVDAVEQQRILRMPLSPPFVPQEVKVLAAGEFPNNVKPLVEANGYLYWPASFDDKLLRTLKDGSGPIETVAETNPFPAELIVVGTQVFYTDNDGVWSKSINCETLPCAGATIYDDLEGSQTAHSLLYRSGSNGFRLYWVEHQPLGGADFTDTIRFRSCGDLFICFLPPAPPQLAPPPPAFYAPSMNWTIGNLVLANDKVFWGETSGADGFLKRKAYNAALADPAEEIGNTLSGLNNLLFVVNDKLFFARRGNGLGIYTISLNATAITRDFVMDAFEITQGIQNLANEAPLVGDKVTYVRAYGKQISGPSTPNVEVQLVGTRNDIPLLGSPLKPINGVRALTTGGGYDRARLNDGWYFLLPPSWTVPGTIKLQVLIDPRHLHTDPNLANNVFPAGVPKQVNFQNQPPVCVMTVPVRTHNPLPSVYDPNVGLMVSNFDRRWPVPETWIFRDSSPVEELEVCTWHYIPYPCFGPYELSDGWGLTNGIPDRDKVISSLWTRALLSFNPDACDDIGAPVHFMGMVHPDADNGGASGYASTISNQSWVQLPAHGAIGSAWDAMREGSTMAQELAHNQGRKHVNCGGPDNIDNGYLYPPCQIANVGADSYYGFDIASRSPIRPDRAADFMSYANKTWVSDYTWKALLNRFATTNVATTAPVAADQAEQVFVTGLVDGENPRGEITIILNVPAASLPSSTQQMAAANAASVQHNDGPHVDYSLRLLDADGATIATHPLTLQLLDDHSEESQTYLFVDLFDKPATQIAQVQLLAGETVVISKTAGINPPVVAIQTPIASTVVGDELTIQWTASDPDPADRLMFTVQYSHNNGASWRTLAINLPSTPEISNTLTISVAGVLHGSAANAALIRVLASDGINTQTSTSQGFTVPNSPPFVAIAVPTAGETLIGGEAILLEGTATDPEDGGLDTSALAWQVDGVVVGTGSTLAVPGLASTVHTAALAATDANSQTMTATVSFNIAPLSVPLAAAPTLDGACNDTSYTTSLNLPLSVYGDETQANVRLLRSDDYLWLCFYNLVAGDGTPGSYVGLRADLDNSRETLVQATDVGFFVGENGDVFTRIGDGAGEFVAPGPGGLQGQVITDTVGWSAELRIEKAQLGGWGHVVNLAVGQHSLTTEGDDYVWPFLAEWGAPNTWSDAALGIQPIISLISPASTSVANSAAAMILGPSLTLTVEGTSLVSGTQVLWDGAVLPTTFITAEVLSAQVTDTLLSSAGIFSITAQSPDGLTSNPVQFVVEAIAPAITGFSPATTTAESDTLLLTINGSNFAANAKAFWNGIALPTQFVNASQLKVTVSATLLETSGTAGITVENATPTVQVSSVAPYVVVPPAVAPVQVQSFMPGLYK